jgi:hypothetical protein
MRTFVDRTGTEWTVWEVRPALQLGASRERRARARRADAAPEPIVERRHVDERRLEEEPAVSGVAPGLAQGWLAFDAGAERRRLAPVPAAWESLSEAALAALCEAADPAVPVGAAAGHAPVRDGS